MISNNVLLIDALAFNLPDEFDGTLTDALEELVKYRKSEEAKTNREIYIDQKDPFPTPKECNEALEQLCQMDNSKLRGSFLLVNRDLEENVYVPNYDKWRYE